MAQAEGISERYLQKLFEGAGDNFTHYVRERRLHGEWHKVRHNRLLFNTDFSEHKLRAAILKGAIQHRLNRMHMRPAARAFQLATDPVLRAMK